MPKIEQYAARGVYDPPAYSQAVKVTGAETILYIAGQVAYDEKGGAAHPATSRRRPAPCWKRLRPGSRLAAARWPTSLKSTPT